MRSQAPRSKVSILSLREPSLSQHVCWAQPRSSDLQRIRRWQTPRRCGSEPGSDTVGTGFMNRGGGEGAPGATDGEGGLVVRGAWW